MEGDGANIEALAETAFFLSYFKDLPDRRQQDKVTYPLDEILLLCLLAVLAGAEAFTGIARFGEKSSTFCAASAPSRTERRRMIIWAGFSPRSTQRRSSAALPLGPPR